MGGVVVQCSRNIFITKQFIYLYLWILNFGKKAICDSENDNMVSFNMTLPWSFLRSSLRTYCFSWCRGTPSSPACCLGALSWDRGNSVWLSHTGRRLTPYETASPASLTHTSSPETSLTDISHRNQKEISVRYLSNISVKL